MEPKCSHLSVELNLLNEEIPQPVEENVRWRQEPQMNNGEGDDSPILSRRGEIVNITSKMQSVKPKPYFYITLAKESPQRNYEESDTSTYSSFHCRETDVCRDSSDTESNSSFTTDGIATMKVLEYEVASASASEDLYSNDSSSGTDDIFLAAVAASAASAMCQSSSLSSDFADTEESDTDIYDPELSSADYWVCIKCKNKQNNPMFRYCEKCYQIRKTHFPPRPRQRKLRREKKKSKRSSSLSNGRKPYSGESDRSSNCILSDYYDDKEVAKRLGNIKTVSSKSQGCSRYQNGVSHYKKRKLNYTNNNTTQLNSAAESSSDEESWREKNYAKNLSLGKRKRKPSYRSNRGNLSTNKSSSDNMNLSANSIKNSVDINLGRKRKISISLDQENFVPLKRLDLSKVTSESNANPKTSAESDIETDIPSNEVNSQKDSGISSALSSQEMMTSSLSRDRKLKIIEKDFKNESSDTVCEELDEKDLAELEKFAKSPKSNTNETEKLGAQLPKNFPLSPTSSTHVSLSGVCLPRSISDCLEPLSEVASQLGGTLKQTCSDMINTSKISLTGNLQSSRYGSCMICLSGPKNGVFVHSNLLHLCCCYKCAVKIWNKNKRCPICQGAVKNVMKLFVH